jgi:hypothetical protein
LLIIIAALILTIIAHVSGIQSALSTIQGLILSACLVAVCVSFYFLPFIIGRRRNISTTGALFIVNLISGWKLVGWFGCLLWAAVGATKVQDNFYRNQHSSG